MCVIIHKKKGVAISNKTIELAFNANSHGVGVYCNGKVNKGFMCLKNFLKSKALHEARKLENEAIFHFRIASVGSVKPALTHPFRCRHGYLFHNGTLELGNKDRSDTMELAELLNKYSYNNACEILGLLGDNSGSKFVLASPSHGTKLFGDFKEYKKLLVSNTYFKPIVLNSTKITNWSNLGNWDTQNDDYLLKNWSM